MYIIDKGPADVVLSTRDLPFKLERRKRDLPSPPFPHMEENNQRFASNVALYTRHRFAKEGEQHYFAL